MRFPPRPRWRTLALLAPLAPRPRTAAAGYLTLDVSEWSGDDGPYHLLLTPTAIVEHSYNVWVESIPASQSEYDLTIKQPAGLEFMLTMWGASGIAYAATTDVMTVGTSDNTSCFLTDAEILNLYSFSFTLETENDDDYPPQCSNISFSWPTSLESNVTADAKRSLPAQDPPVDRALRAYDGFMETSTSENTGNTTSPPTIFGVIPLGNSFSIPITFSNSSAFAASLPSTSLSDSPTTTTSGGTTYMNWTVDMAKGTRFLLVAGIGSEQEWASGGSSRMFTVGQGSTGCTGGESTGDSAPSVTATDTSSTSTTTVIPSGGGSSGANPVVRTVVAAVCSVVGTLIVVGVILFVRRSRNRRKAAAAAAAADPDRDHDPDAQAGIPLASTTSTKPTAPGARRNGKPQSKPYTPLLALFPRKKSLPKAAIKNSASETRLDLIPSRTTSQRTFDRERERSRGREIAPLVTHNLPSAESPLGPSPQDGLDPFGDREMYKQPLYPPGPAHGGAHAGAHAGGTVSPSRSTTTDSAGFAGAGAGVNAGAGLSLGAGMGAGLGAGLGGGPQPLPSPSPWNPVGGTAAENMARQTSTDALLPSPSHSPSPTPSPLAATSFHPNSVYPPGQGRPLVLHDPSARDFEDATTDGGGGGGDDDGSGDVADLKRETLAIASAHPPTHAHAHAPAPAAPPNRRRRPPQPHHPQMEYMVHRDAGRVVPHHPDDDGDPGAAGGGAARVVELPPRYEEVVWTDEEIREREPRAGLPPPPLQVTQDATRNAEEGREGTL